jgi:hypothetical protein
MKKRKVKSWKKSLHIWKKICQRVRLTKVDDYYYVETREDSKSDWEQSPSYSSIKRALVMKHNYIQRIIRDMGYQSFLKEKRIKRRGY